jgi:NADH:ubiquinone oxidoreductase subunit H
MVTVSIWLIALSLYVVLNLILVVAFLTLFERKVLASIQKRKGPN